MNEVEIRQLLQFIGSLEELKKIERWKGQVFWRDYSFPDRYEFVADHTWRVAMMLIVIQKHLSQPINIAKAMKMALIHDVPEIVVGDASPLGSDGTGKDSHAYSKEIAEQKSEEEKKAAKKIFGELGEGGSELYDLWLEYEMQQSFEARVAKALDKIEAKIQALEYSEGKLFKENLDFMIRYGVETFAVDPSIQVLGDAIIRDVKDNFSPYTEDRFVDS